MKKSIPFMAVVAMLLTIPLAVAQEVSLTGPDTVTINGAVEVHWTGPDAQGDYIAIGDASGVPVRYASYVYTARNDGIVSLTAPQEPGSYSVVYVAGAGREPLEFIPLTVEAATATLQAPAGVSANDSFTVAWTGPDNHGDYVAVGNADGTILRYASRSYTAQYPAEAPLTAPEEPGAYSVIYVTGETVVDSIPLQVGGLDATLEVADPVMAGSPFAVAWSGPDNEGDRIRVHDAEGMPMPHASYAYTSLNPATATLVAPEAPGAYTVAYVTGDTVVTTLPLTVTEVTAGLDAPEEVPAGLPFPVHWTGPGNPRDVIEMVAGDPDPVRARGYIASSVDGTVMLEAPADPGGYELRYRTPGGRDLAARPVSVVAPPQKPGALEVLSATQASSLSALEVILDASGSMLQRQDGRRRIDIAKTTLSRLVQETVPQGTPFALRVFGHRTPDSCRTDLEVPLTPLDRASVLALIDGVEATNLARTPIARSLELVASDLAAADGKRIVILVTDGEETCEGDPAAAIGALRGAGADIRVNIIGYAIDDAGLAGTFSRWAELGGGAYFGAGNEDELTAALLAAAQPAFTVVDTAGVFIAGGLAGGEPIALPAGSYEARLDGGGAVAVDIRPETVTTVTP